MLLTLVLRRQCSKFAIEIPKQFKVCHASDVESDSDISSLCRTKDPYKVINETVRNSDVVVRYVVQGSMEEGFEKYHSTRRDV